MKIINHAFEVLSDPERRAAHNAWIAEQEAAARAESAVNHCEAKQVLVDSYTGPLYNQYQSPRPPPPADRIATAREAYRAERMNRASPRDTAPTQTRDDQPAPHAPATAPVTTAPFAPSVSGTSNAGLDGAGGQNAARAADNTTNAPKPEGLLSALIALLKYSGMLSGLILYGQLSSLNESIRPEFSSAWGDMKLQLWLVWVIGVIAYFAAGRLLERRLLDATRWKAAGLIWAGAIAAPLAGLLIAPIGLPHDLAIIMPAIYVPKAIRGLLFAVVCTLYLRLSRRVKHTYADSGAP
jgi:hypothetical protein